VAEKRVEKLMSKPIAAGPRPKQLKIKNNS
jgi:hypothetical protein